MVDFIWTFDRDDRGWVRFDEAMQMVQFAA